MRKWNLCMRHRLQDACKHVKDTFSRVPFHMRTWPTRYANGEEPREFHGNWHRAIRFESQRVWMQLVVYPLLNITKWCEHRLMDTASRMAGTKNVSRTRDSTLPIFISMGVRLDESENCLKMHYKSDSEVGLEAAERKLVQLMIARKIVEECAFLYDTYHEHLHERSSPAVKHSIYALIAIRLCVLEYKGKQLGLHDALRMMRCDLDHTMKELGVSDGMQSFREAYNWIKKTRDTVLAHVVTKNNKQDILDRVHIEWMKSDEYVDVLYPRYTDDLASRNKRYGFIGSIAVTEQTFNAVDRIMRKPVRTPCGPIEVQLFDLALALEREWQNMIAMRFKGSKMIFRR